MKAIVILGVISVFFLTPAVSYALEPIVHCGFSVNGAPTIPCTACDFFALASNAIRWLVALITLVITLVVVWAGLMIATAGGNEYAVYKAKYMLTNALIGFAILLSAWLIVDTLMKITKFGEGSALGPWNTINVNACKAPARTTIPGPTPGTPTTPNPGNPYTGKVSQCPPSNPYCSVDALTRAGFTASQANVMSCIAMTESSGNPDTPPHNQTHPGSNSTACGLFQVVRTTWNNTRSRVNGSQDFYAFCRNASCNTAITLQLVKQRGYGDWTCPGCNNKAQACVDKYGG